MIRRILIIVCSPQRNFPQVKERITFRNQPNEFIGSLSDGIAMSEVYCFYIQLCEPFQGMPGLTDVGAERRHRPHPVEQVYRGVAGKQDPLPGMIEADRAGRVSRYVDHLKPGAFYHVTVS